MDKIIEFTTESGEKMWVEVDEKDLPKPKSEMENVSYTDKVIKGIQQSFRDVLGIIKTTGNEVIKNVEALDKKPKEISVEMSLKFNGEVGYVIAKANSEANLKITLKWADDSSK